MNGIHDVGGADGFGPITVEVDEPVFHAEWEKAALSFFPQLAVAGYFNLDEFRSAMEEMHPVEYMTSPYYAHWMHSFEKYLNRHDPSFGDELERRTQEYLDNPDKPLPETVNHELADVIGALAYSGAPTRREVQAAPKFAVGDRVRVSHTVPVTHTRKTNYVRGAVGEVIYSHGGFVLPDSSAIGGGESPEHVYGVRFSAADLFGETIADPSVYNNVDLWESYLSRVED
jgi:nitrile hydratase